MRFPLLLFALALGAQSAAAAPTASAQLFAERTALLAGDGQCRLLAPGARAALTATALQARSAALRDGWSPLALDGVAARAADAGRTRSCKDRTLREAAQRATDGYLGWAKLPSMDFPGASRIWAARRVADPNGWILSQTLPNGVKFGLAQAPKGQALVLAIPGASPGPATATLFLRDRVQAPRPLLDLPGRPAAAPLAEGLTPRSLETARMPNRRVVYRPSGGLQAQTLFVFPASVLNEIAALDPRESVEIELPAENAPSRLVIEVGALAAAQAFLAAKVS